MAVSIVMPALEMAQETGKIISWLKKEGDSIAKGEPLAEIETDKVVLELEAAADGVLAGVKRGRRRCGAGGQDHRVDRRAGRKAAGGNGFRCSGRSHHDRAIATGRGPVSSRTAPALRKWKRRCRPKRAAWRRNLASI